MSLNAVHFTTFTSVPCNTRFLGGNVGKGTGSCGLDEKKTFSLLGSPCWIQSRPCVPLTQTTTICQHIRESINYQIINKYFVCRRGRKTRLTVHWPRTVTKSSLESHREIMSKTLGDLHVYHLRHTDRTVSSTPSVTWGGVPPPIRVPPSQAWWGGGGNPRWGTPARSDGGYLRWGTPVRVPPLSQVRWGEGGTRGGVPPIRVPPLARSDRGYPRWCGQTENITFPHPSDAVGNNSRVRINWISCRLVHIVYSNFLSTSNWSNK